MTKELWQIISALSIDQCQHTTHARYGVQYCVLKAAVTEDLMSLTMCGARTATNILFKILSALSVYNSQ